MSFRRLPVRLQSIKEKERKTEALAYLLRNLDDFSASMLQNSVVVRRILTSVFRSFSLTDCTAHSNAFEKTYTAAGRKLRLDLSQLGATGGMKFISWGITAGKSDGTGRMDSLSTRSFHPPSPSKFPQSELSGTRKDAASLQDRGNPSLPFCRKNLWVSVSF